ncbi:MAG: hypothetical protein AAF442_04875 [Pseudomonadota bacterium]
MSAATTKTQMTLLWSAMEIRKHMHGENPLGWHWIESLAQTLARLAAELAAEGHERTVANLSALVTVLDNGASMAQTLDGHWGRKIAEELIRLSGLLQDERDPPSSYTTHPALTAGDVA